MATGSSTDDSGGHPGAAIVFGTSSSEDDIRSCAACHGPWDAPLSAEHSSLLGQRYPYLIEQMNLWKIVPAAAATA